LREVPAIVEEMDDWAEVRQMISENSGAKKVSGAEQGVTIALIGKVRADSRTARARGGKQ